ncbi:ADP-heptose synthase / D-glycero-beta-D-manno-heptose 7-phosphate kinase [hydrothermal vent metagenome]|uniref:D-glycero-beta-D-manno-heptose 1-phosphate adenylyltransferase n=1 Tax=hydrothermal vent metagenome TaxID=652676 RepID=A0A3B1E622_9ZZZZ
MITKIKKPNILVVGDLMIDHYIYGETTRISPEAPVQVIDVNHETTVLGGAGNVVNNLVSLGSDVTIMSVVGDDKNSHELTNMLDHIKVNHFLICEKNRKTSKKSRIIASHQQVVRYDNETKNDITNKNELNLLEKFTNNIIKYDIVILSDYAKGTLTFFLTSKLIEIANSHNIKVLVDPKDNNYTKYKGAYLLTPNKQEAIKATNIEIKDNDSLKKALNNLKKISLLTIPIITLSEEGIAFLNKNGEVVIKPTVAREIYDVTGAGDTVIATLGFSLANNSNIEDAIEFANLSAGVVVAKLGSATVTIDEIEEYKSSLHKSSIESHIKNFEEIGCIVKRLKKQNKKIVFTNGCFDILHKGHVSYLDVAKSYGDVLILGLNSDESVKRLKGNSRPINNQEDRGFILAALESVDYVINFSEDTPYELIKIVKPDILVKGADYKDKKVVGSDIVREVKLVTFCKGKSTTQTIDTIKKGLK